MFLQFTVFIGCSLETVRFYTFALRNGEIFKCAYTPKRCLIIYGTIFKYHIVTTDQDCIQHRPNIDLEWVFLQKTVQCSDVNTIAVVQDNM